MDNRNVIIAIVLSVVVLFGWQYFVAGPQLEQARQAAVEADQRAAAAIQPGGAPAVPAAPGVLPAAPGTPATPAAALATVVGRDEALALAPGRVVIDTPRVTGSINLRGARIDDLRLDDYRVTVEDDSPTVVLLSPENAVDGYYAEFGWIGEAGSVPQSDAIWTAPAGATLTPATPVTLTWTGPTGITVERTVAIDDQYMFTVTDRVTNGGAAAAQLSPYGQVARWGEPLSTGFFILHEGPIGVIGQDGLQEIAYTEVVDAGTLDFAAATRGWLGFTDKYWAATLVPVDGTTFTSRFAYFSQNRPMYQALMRGEAVSVAPGGTTEMTTRLFAGAKQVAVVDGYEASLNIDRFELLIDWGWFYFITKPMFFLLDFMFRLFGNFGVAILAVTVIVKAVFFPLANRSYKSMSAMRKVGPQMQALRERHKDDRVKQQQALMELYKKEKINPIAGCWPILVQIPVFFALYKVLFITIEMRHAPFFGWIQDLSAPDPTSLFNLFGLLPFTPPALLAIGVWPVLMGVSQWVQMRLNPQPPDRTQQIIFNWLPVVFVFMLASFPAGLVIYWTWNNTLSVIQQSFIMKRQGVPVDLFGNIRNSFRRKPAAVPASGSANSNAKPGKSDTKPADAAK